MIARIHSTTIVVTDQDKSLDFFTNVLGWSKSIDQPMGPDMRFVTVVPPGAQTELVLAHTSWAGPLPEGGHTGISLITPEIDATVADLTAKGVKFKGEVEMMPWGDKAIWFYDIDGNEFFLDEMKIT